MERIHLSMRPAYGEEPKPPCDTPHASQHASNSTRDVPPSPTVSPLHGQRSDYMSTHEGCFFNSYRFCILFKSNHSRRRERRGSHTVGAWLSNALSCALKPPQSS
mmetsp:Transcript_35520/g.86321  ORF Transcript_35520/g.86321 Transcript_35520/m.86321 type:complete len:105 (+) Transcript_35520:388-702(+)